MARIEIIVIAVTAFLVANLYTDGKYARWLMSKKKFFQMGLLILGAILVYWTIKTNPLTASSVMANNEYLKYLPMDQNTSQIISPILDFTSKHNSLFGGDATRPRIDVSDLNRPKQMVDNVASSSSFVPKTKRSVSDMRKRLVASNQGWRCGDCNEQLSAWFEVDHIQRLDRGGSNEVNNLCALCPNCHRKKTFCENL